MRRLAMLLPAVAMAAVLAACGERPQTISSGNKGDAAAFEGTQNHFAAPGWTAGDKRSWEQGLKARMQNSQNEYSKI